MITNTLKIGYDNEGRGISLGYIASGEFNGNRIPQHIQNQVVKQYCDQNGLVFVLSERILDQWEY